MSEIDVQPALPEDLLWLSEFVARINEHPAHQSLYCAPGTARTVKVALRSEENFPGGWERSFVVARTDGAIMAALGCQLDLDHTRGRLWGPWVSGKKEAWSLLAPTMLDRLSTSMPVSMERWEAFLNTENQDGLRFFEAQGFRLGPVTHIYVLPRKAWRPMDNHLFGCQTLRPAHEVAFTRLHSEMFPSGASTSPEDLLAGRNEERTIFSATDGLKLLGYVCVSINRVPYEGFVDYLAVRPTARD